MADLALLEAIHTTAVACRPRAIKMVALMN